MQFIDGRLDLLNAGEGFSDIFEDEINMGEYAGDVFYRTECTLNQWNDKFHSMLTVYYCDSSTGSDKTYHQWLFTVKVS